MHYIPTVKLKNPQQARGLQPGQWIEVDGVKGRFMGRGRAGVTVWNAWGATARKRFSLFAKAYRAEMARKPFRLDPSKDIGDGGIHRIL